MMDLLSLFRPFLRSYSEIGFSNSNAKVKVFDRLQSKFKAILLSKLLFNKNEYFFTLFKNKIILIGSL